jgi:hypothetical protein
MTCFHNGERSSLAKFGVEVRKYVALLGADTSVAFTSYWLLLRGGIV